MLPSRGLPQTLSLALTATPDRLPWPKDVQKVVIVSLLTSIAILAIENGRRFIDSHGQILASDFSVFRFASLLLWNGDLGTIFDAVKFIAAHEAYEQAPVGFSPFPYPPNALWFVAPLAALPAMPGLLLWLGLT